MYRLLQRLNAWSVQHPFLIIATWLLAAILAGTSLTQLKMNPTADAWLKKGDHRLDGLKHFRSEFDAGRNIVIMLSTASGDMFTAGHLQALRDIHAGLAQLPHTVRIDSLVNAPYSVADGDDLSVHELLGQHTPLDEGPIGEVRRRALADQRLVHRLVNAQGSAAVAVATFVPDIDADIEMARQAYAQAQSLIATVQADNPELHFALSGSVAAMAAYFDAAMHDAMVLLPLALALALLAMLGYLRFESGAWRTAAVSVGAVLLLIICVVTIPMALMPLLGIEATNVAVVIPVAILTLAVADCLHILITYYQQRPDAAHRNAALLSSLQTNAEAVWITSLTTALGFLTLNVSWALPYIVMGNLVALGVFLAWLATNTLFPALLSLATMQVSAQSHSVKPMRRLARQVIRHQRWILLGTLGSLIIMAIGIPQNRMNDAWLEYLREDTRFGSDMKRLQEELGGIATYEFLLDSGSPNGIYEPAFLASVGAFADWLEAQPEVSYVQGLHTTIKQLNANLHGADPDHYALPKTRDEAAQYLLLYELSLPFGASLTNEVNLDKSALRLVAGLDSSDTITILGLRDRALHWFDVHAPALKSSGTGDSIIISALSVQLTQNMIINTIMVLLAITVTIALMFRSPGYGVLSLLVNTMPILVSLGIWGLLVGNMGMGSSLVFSMTIGIIVDYSVHFLSKYRIARREKALDTHQAIEYSFSTVGIALLVTSGVLVLNFGLLCLSDHKLNIYMGGLIAITIVVALLSQLFLLPVLLLLADRYRRWRLQPAVSPG